MAPRISYNQSAVKRMLKENARYKLALQNIAKHVPYAFAQELAKNALDLGSELMIHSERKYELTEEKDHGRS